MGAFREYRKLRESQRPSYPSIFGVDKSMVIAIGIVIAIVVCLSSIAKPRRMNRAERLWLNGYEQKARCDGAYPFDYLTR